MTSMLKRILLTTAGVLSLAGLAWMQVNQTDQKSLASLMPAGPLIYVQAKNFHSLLDEWNQSGVKRDWLASANYQVFSNSNVLQKLEGLYREYGAVAGFLPGLGAVLELAGRESALGLYDLREQQFVYLTRVDESQLEKSQLWRLREKFTTRQSSGMNFYIRRDDASNRTIAFAFTSGWLILATRDDLMANTLALIVGQNGAQSLANEPWFAPAIAQAGAPGELRMVLNFPSLLADVHFRSYWIQRNASELHAFSGEIADVQRTSGEIREDRILTRLSGKDATPPTSSALDSTAALRSLTPPDAALARAWASPSPAMIGTAIEAKLLQPASDRSGPREYVPPAAATDEAAGSEQDLETRIDEPPLSAGIAGSLQAEPLRQLISRAQPDAFLEVQSSARSGAFVRTPCVLVISSPTAWDTAPLRDALSSAVETLWSTSRLGVEWQSVTLGQHAAQRLNGLGGLLFAIDDRRLFIANDPALLSATLNRIGTAPLTSGPAYAADVGVAQEQPDYLKITQALDFTEAVPSFFFVPQGSRTPKFFSENVASLTSVFRFVQSITITRTEFPGFERQRVVILRAPA